MPENRKPSDGKEPFKNIEDQELTSEQASEVKGGAVARVGWEVNVAYSGEETSARISTDGKK